MMVRKTIAMLAVAALCAAAGNIKVTALRNDIFVSIRKGDIATVKTALATGADVNAKDPEGSTPLMYAALYSNADCMRLLLEHGADVNAANGAGGTALIWSAGNMEKVRLLVEHGADVNAQSKLGKTPLLSAASRDGSGPVVRYLLEHGARIDVKDSLDGIPIIPIGGGANTPVMEAAKARDGEALRILLDKGAPVNERAKNNSTALLSAIAYGNTDNARLLIKKGADVNAAVTGGMTPLMLAAMENDAETMALLLEKGAKVDAEDMGGNTAVMWAAYSELDRPGLVKLLVEAGADMNHKNKAGETALTWAARRGDTRTVAFLKEHGAQGAAPAGSAMESMREVALTPANVAAAIDHAIPSMLKSGQAVFKQRGCVSCHNNMMPVIAASMAENRGHVVDQQVVQRERKTLLAFIRPVRELLAENCDNMPDTTVTGPWILMTLASSGYEADAITDALVHNIALKQRGDGSFPGWAPRPPIEYGAIQSTALSIRAMQLYPLEGRREEFQTRIWKAARWLAAAIPSTNEDASMKVMGLTWAKGDAEAIQAAAKQLLGEQRADGGWAQLPTLASDAYATGEALMALHDAGILSTRDRAWKRGIEYLLRTQQADGTWHVKSRSYPFQPYFESGYPYGPDQWISVAGASWATMALLQNERQLTARR